MSHTKVSVNTKKAHSFPIYTTKYDTTTLEIKVEDIIFNQPQFELLGIKSDKNEVRQTEGFTLQEDSSILVTLAEQFVTCDGPVELQLVMKDGARTSTAIFTLIVNRSLDSDILESHRDVKTLDELEKYISEGRKAVSEAVSVAQETLKQTQAVNTKVVASESQRAQNELQRQSAETTRIESEQERKSQELLRQTKEQERQTEEQKRRDNETKRVASELGRAQNESTRELKEESRQSSEKTRELAERKRVGEEQLREESESQRKSNEKTRQTEESSRQVNEATRIENETLRTSEEVQRQSNEVSRATQESSRQLKEEERIKAESSRQSKELTREQNESTRKSQESIRQEKEVERQSAETIRQNNEVLRQEQYQESTQVLESLKEFESVKPTDRLDYMGNQHQSLRDTSNANVDYAVKTAIGEFNYLDYEGQHITATNSIEGHARSAILKGNTLVNLNTNKQKQVTITSNVDYRTNFLYSIKSGTKITIKMSLNDNSLTKELMLEKKYTDGTSGFQDLTPSIIEGRINITFHEQKDISTANFYLQGSETGSITIKDVVILEGDYTNVDIPYFEGMKSVKMPVLQTTGKNLFDGKWIENSGNSTSLYSNPIKVIPNRYYKINLNTTEHIKGITVYFYDINGNIINYQNRVIGLSPNESVYMKWYITRFSDMTKDYLQTITQIEETQNESSTSTSYEPFKSNILSTPSDVILRKVGSVEDTLNINTGEYIQRIGEIVLDESLNYQGSSSANGENTMYFQFDLGAYPSSIPVSSHFKVSSANLYVSTNDYEGIRITSSGSLQLRVLKSKLNSLDVNGLKEYLKQNNISLQYQLATESVKTVDLSDNVVYSYNGTTHYSCSSEEGSLVPTLSVKVPTDVQATISNQKAKIQSQESQIISLEKENEILTKEQLVQDENIITSLLASTELFEMILSLSPMTVSRTPQSEGVNQMVEVYVTLILKSQKTIEQVPAIIREQVQTQLDLLTK